MTAEKNLRGNVLKTLRKAGLDARPVENPVDPGFPDVEYIGGVLELKSAARWPKRSSTPLRVPHYTQQQRIWHERRAARGGRVHVLIQVGKEFLLFTGAVASLRLGHLPRTELLDFASGHWTSLSDMMSQLPSALRQ
jgi:hypothetical protein